MVAVENRKYTQIEIAVQEVSFSFMNRYLQMSLTERTICVKYSRSNQDMIYNSLAQCFLIICGVKYIKLDIYKFICKNFSEFIKIFMNLFTKINIFA